MAMAAEDNPGDGEAKRLVVVVPNHYTALSPSLVNPLVELLGDGVPTLLVSDAATPELEALRDRAGIPLRLVPKDGLPPLAHLRQNVVERQRYLEAAQVEDEFLCSLPLPGVEEAGTTTLFRDRFQWTIASQDVRPFVEALPWDNCEELVVLGGLGVATCLASLCVSEARRRERPVHGVIKGPVSGRWSPMWLHGCTTLSVGHQDLVYELFRLGVTTPARVNPLLENTLELRPLELSAASPQELWLDLDNSSLAQVVRPALVSFVRDHPGALSRLIIPCNPLHEKLCRFRYGDSIAEVPIHYHLGHQINEALKAPLAALSCDPYTLYHSSEFLPGLRLGMMPLEVEAMQAGIPGRLRRFIPSLATEKAS